MFTPLPTPKEMAAWDRAAMDGYGVRNEMLMENASREALRVLREELGPLRGKRALLLAGKGNNGGDAIALGRHLLDQGCEVLVLLAAAKEHYKGVSGYHLRLARKIGVRTALLKHHPPETWPEAEIIADGLLGTGFSGELRPAYLEWVRAVNARRERGFILALDIPSGLNGLSGKPCPEAVRAHATATFGAAKVGLVMPEAAPCVGKLHVCAIGIPARVLEEAPASHGLLDESVFETLPLPSATMHKGTGGRVAIAAGSAGLTGAACLAALGALRSGAGLVTVACPADIAPQVKHGHPEIMALPLEEGGHWRPKILPRLQEFLENCDAFVIGPGLGRDQATREALEEVLSWKRPPTVWDADALFGLAERPELLDRLGPNDVLTPHPGEMARLIGSDIATVQGARLKVARDFVRQHDVVLALKGAGTVVASCAAPTLLSPFSTSALAVGGSGDVLAGMLGNLLGRGLSPLHATCLAVYWHGFTGTRLERTYPFRGNLATEIAEDLPLALEESMRCRLPKTS